MYLALFTLVWAWILAQQSRAADLTWAGNGAPTFSATNSLVNANRWYPSGGGDWWNVGGNGPHNLSFGSAGSGGWTSITNNSGAWATSFSIFFNSGAPSYTISGDAFSVWGKIENNSANTQTISTDISAANAVKELNPVSGDLVFNSANLYLGTAGGGEWRVWGTKKATINGVISENGTLSIQEGATVILTKTNTYNAATYVRGGELQIQNGGKVGTYEILLGGTNVSNLSNIANSVYLGGAGSAGGVTNTNAVTVYSTGGTSTIGGRNTSGTNTYTTGAIDLRRGVNVDAASGGTVMITSVMSGAGGITLTG
ncbi:hypothetical protein EBX31_13370, partial [bacterium]|nr:hypothetical protein [bacterium]